MTSSFFSKINSSIQEDGIGATGTKIVNALSANLIASLQQLRNEVSLAIEKRRDGSRFIVRDVQGSEMMLDVADVGIGRELALTGVHESLSTKRFREAIKPGMTVIEVGANIGYYLLIARSIVGEEGKIIAFEPSPHNLKLLRVNVGLNEYEKNVEIFPYGIGAAEDEQEFYLMSKCNMSSFVPRQESGDIKRLATIKTRIVSLDDFFEGQQEKLDFLRMDVEGFEEEVIQGMAGLLEDGRAPTGMFIEVHSKLLGEKGSSSAAFIGKLKDYGYEVDIASWRGREDMTVSSTKEMLDHPSLEKGYWEAFFLKSQET